MAGLSQQADSLPPASEPTERILALLMRGPSAPFKGVQSVHVRLNGVDLASAVRVFADGRGSTRHEYEGSAAGNVVIKSPAGIWHRSSTGEWVEMATTVVPVESALRAAARNYAISVAPAGILFGHPALSVRIVPKQAFNPSRRVILDGTNGTIFRDELYAPDGSLRSSSAFVSLAFRPQPSSLFTPPLHKQPAAVGPGSFSVRLTAAAVQQDTGLSIPKPAYCPPGYSPALYGVMRTGSGRLMPAVRYSDGLASFTIFRRGQGPRAGRGYESRASSTSNQESVVAFAGRDANYLLIGDIGMAELDRVAHSLP